MKLGIQVVIALAIVFASSLPSSARDKPKPQSVPLKFKTKPICVPDKDDPDAPTTPRDGTIVTLRFRVAASGEVEDVEVIPSQHAGESVAVRFARWEAHCWRSAAFETAGVDPALFPIEQVVRITFRTRDASEGKPQD